MTLKKCILTRNDCYTCFTKIKGKPAGIVVHSTGVNNPMLQRYVQPLKGDFNYDKIIEDIGVNRNKNHWNTSFSTGETNQQACVHAFIGKNAAGKTVTYQTLPFDYCAWGVGNGSKGSYNWNPQAHIQFEICEDDYTDFEYFKSAFAEAAQFCAYLCRTFGISVGSIISHAEACKLGYGCNHADCDHWLKVYGRTMDDFRADVSALLYEDGKISGVNIFRDTDFLVLYKDKASTETNVFGFEAAFDSHGTAQCNPLYGRGNMEIPKDGFVLSGHGKAGIWLALNIEKCCRVYIDGDMVRILPRITATWDKGYLSGENICRDEGFLVLYRNVASTGTNQYGVEVAVRNGTAISNPVYGQGNMSVPEGGFVLSGHGMAGSWLAANIAEGYIVDICNNTVSASLPEAKQEISVGSKVKVRDGAPTYDGTALAPFVYKRTHVVREIKGERAVITFCGIVVAAVRLSDLIPAE